MKKLSLYIFLGLFFCNVGFAKVFDFKCTSFSERKHLLETHKWEENYDYKIMIHVQLDTSQKTIKIFNDWDSEESHDIYKIDKITDNQYRSGDSLLEGDEKFLFLNRYTGVLVKEYKTYSPDTVWTYFYQCEPTEQLY